MTLVRAQAGVDDIQIPPPFTILTDVATMSDAHEPGDAGMHIDAHRAKQLADNLSHVLQRVQSASSGRKVSVIAVSKLKPANDILALHDSPHAQRDFGENYAQELTDKAALLPRSIRWHMIGGLQTNKCRPLAEQVANLYCVSSVDTTKKADALEKGRAALAGRDESGANDLPPLKILVQVNTSGEENKSGVEPGEAAELCRHVRDECPHLELAGLMTIGAIARSQEASTSESINEDFVSLKETRGRVAKELGVDADTLRLSMGMSSDFEAAISQGSDEVRVGTTIFGERPPKKDAKVKNDVAKDETT